MSQIKKSENSPSGAHSLEGFMSFEDALVKLHEAASMVRAAGARQGGTFDDPELLKLGPLKTAGADILRIMRPARKLYHELCTALNVVEDYIVNHCDERG